MKAVARGPIKVIESHGIRIPIYNSPTPSGQPGFLLAYYIEGRRKQERAKTLSEAEQHAKAKIKELASGVAHVGTLTPRETVIVTESISIARELGVPLLEAMRQFAEAAKILTGQGSVVDAARVYVQHASRREIPRKTLSEVVSEFLIYIETTGLSKQYLRDSRARLERAAKAMRTQILNITTAEIEAWLEAQGKRSPRAHNNDRNAISTLFRFARKKGYLRREIETAADAVPKRKDIGGDIQILTPSNFALLLSNTPTVFLPYVALGGLAGLRTAEISRLEWEEIDFQQGHIVISARKAKTASRRIVPLCDALKSWLAPLAKTSGQVMPYANEQSLMNQWSRAKALMVDGNGKPLVSIPTNALRHSYASYRLALLEDAAKVALEMGNSPRKLFSNYRQLTTKSVAEKWFAITRPTSAKQRRKR